jgi:hypothetical protein
VTRIAENSYSMAAMPFAANVIQHRISPIATQRHTI